MKDMKKAEQSLVDGQRKKLKEELMKEILRELKPMIAEVLKEGFLKGEIKDERIKGIHFDVCPKIRKNI